MGSDDEDKEEESDDDFSDKEVLERYMFGPTVQPKEVIPLLAQSTKGSGVVCVSPQL